MTEPEHTPSGRGSIVRHPTVRKLTSDVYGPSFFAGIGIGAMYPILALSALALGASPSLAAGAIIAYTAGRLVGIFGGGRLAQGIGAPRASLVALVGLIFAALSAAGAPHLATFFIAAAATGVAHAALHVTRQAQVLEIVPDAFRARALTTLAGVWRIANFLGPLGGAVVISVWGLASAYIFAAVMAAIGAGVLAATRASRLSIIRDDGAVESAWDVARKHRAVLVTLGMAVSLTSGIRYVRLVAIPVWGEHLGLSEGTISTIFALSAAVDMLLFIPAGIVMDRWGRWWTAVPSTLLFAVVIFAFPISTSTVGLTVLALGLGLANGWGSGLLMTLGTDVAPERGKPYFIGWWMTLQDAGGLLGGGIFALGALVSAATGLWAAGALGAAATVAMHAFVPIRGRSPHSLEK